MDSGMQQQNVLLELKAKVSTKKVKQYFDG